MNEQFVIYIYYIDTSILLENIPLVKFIKTWQKQYFTHSLRFCHSKIKFTSSRRVISSLSLYIYIYIVLVTALYVDRRIQNMLFIVFKAINNIYSPEYLRDLLRLRDNIKTGLRGVNKLLVPSPNTTRYGKNSVKYLGAITWNEVFTPEDPKGYSLLEKQFTS